MFQQYTQQASSTTNSSDPLKQAYITFIRFFDREARHLERLIERNKILIIHKLNKFVLHQQQQQAIPQ